MNSFNTLFLYEVDTKPTLTEKGKDLTILNRNLHATIDYLKHTIVVLKII